MARIRTIKPEFFTSDDICALSPLARLLYIGLWCEADREGRLVWTPRVFKRRYLPDDPCDAAAVAAELVERGLVVPYGDGYAWIPTLARHQLLNPRESASKLPPPDGDASPRTNDASPRVDECAPLGKEGEGTGKGEEGEGASADAPSRVASRPARKVAHALPEGWQPDAADLAWSATARPDLSAEAIAAETERFRNHAAATGRTAQRWGPYWRNWITRAHVAKASTLAAAKTMQAGTGTVDRDSDQQWRARLRGYRPGGFWLEGDWGPRPESDRSRVPEPILAEWRAATA
jgi:hypothetical protein